MGVRRIMAAVLLAWVSPGCGGSRPSPSTAPSTPITQRPVTQPAIAILTETPATAPTTQPGMATLVIGEQGFWFPAAILRLSLIHGQVTARLSTDDPPAAIEDNYHGNCIDLNMPLTITDAAQIDQAVWKFAADSNERPDNSPHGIFLDGQRRRLHPQDVTAEFQKSGDKVVVLLSGWFLLDESTAADRSFSLPRRVSVQGRLEATLAR